MTLLADLLGFTGPAAVCGAAWAAVLAHGTFAPAGSLWGPVVSRAADRTRPRVALTFDDGPTPGSTERILDVLGAAGVGAAFFVVGRNVERWPRLVERMDAEGHVVGNHTWDHSHYGVFRRDEYWRRQVDRTDRLIESILGRRPAMFRPPMGIKTWHVTGAARRAGHAVVTWNRRAMDGVATDAARIIARLATPAAAGDVLLLHDGVEPNTPRRDTRATEAAVGPLVARLRDKGLEPARVDAVLGIRAYQGGGDGVA
jgi:peptidoglycan/xylan/chitin deacetylase (PgdA/CDA1 family)